MTTHRAELILLTISLADFTNFRLQFIYSCLFVTFSIKWLAYSAAEIQSVKFACFRPTVSFFVAHFQQKIPVLVREISNGCAAPMVSDTPTHACCTAPKQLNLEVSHKFKFAIQPALLPVLCKVFSKPFFHIESKLQVSTKPYNPADCRPVDFVPSWTH